MKIMTLNTHSLVEQHAQEKLQRFVCGVLAEMPDVIALQEVNQTIIAPSADGTLLTGYVPAQRTIPIRTDNHAANAARLLREAGVKCSWTYLPIKVGYQRFDEGLALLSLNRKILHVESCLISRADNYRNWKTRKALCMQVEGLPDWFCTVHMGWWQDDQDSFLDQWKVLNTFLNTKPRQNPVWLMGDFNTPAEVRGEGYDKITAAGWHDTFLFARERDRGVTVPGAIDGWQDQMKDSTAGGMRIDLIWCSLPEKIASSRVVFNGENHPVVSDHFGVMIETSPHSAEASQTPRNPWGGMDHKTEDDT